MEETHFKEGTEVEVRSDEEGFRGAWYAATVVRSIPKKSKYTVQYHDLMSDEDESKPLIETVDSSHVRPRPPRELDCAFEVREEVDALYNDGWWVGVISKVLDESSLKYAVLFRNSKEEMEFERSDLRVHLDWLDGRWVRALKQRKVETKLTNGTLVEVSSDEEGFRGAWFTATIIKVISKNEFLVQYRDLRTDDETKLLTEMTDSLHIRPCPPDTPELKKFKLLEEVDALYNDGWWIGIIAKVLKDSRYIVYFRNSKEELEFRHSELRLHQDWINGRWVRASEALNL